MLHTPSECERLRLHTTRLELLAETPANEEPREVRPGLNASTDFAYGRCGLEQGDLVACLSETVRCRQSTQAAPNNDDVEGEGSFAAIVEVNILSMNHYQLISG